MRRVQARSLLTALFLSFSMIATAYPASAGGWGHHGNGHGGYYHGGHHYKHFKRHHGHRYHHYGHRRHHHGHHRHHRRHGNDDFLLGAGIIGGAIVLGGVLSQPRYAPPPPVVYYAPPPQPYCEQDQVYRYLPDGSIQWGTRTRCY